MDGASVGALAKNFKARRFNRANALAWLEGA